MSKVDYNKAIPERAYEKYMPTCKVNCPSTGCYKKLTNGVLNYQCVNCGMTSANNITKVSQAAVDAMHNEAMQVFNSFTNGESN